MKPKSDKSLYDIVQDYLATLDSKKAKALKSAIKKYFYLRSGMSDFKPNGDNHSEKFRKQTIRQLYFGFGLPYHHYMDKEEVITPYSPNHPPLEVFYHLERTGKNPIEEKQFVKKYVSSMERYIKSTQNRIWVYDYLGIGQGKVNTSKTSISHYNKAHAEIFGLIEEQMANQQEMNYLRILVLPISEQEGRSDNRTTEEKTRDAILACSLETYTHICRCLANYPQRTKFYVTWHPTRMYHYGLIDENYIVSEYYRYTSGGEFIPNLLFVENATHEHGEKSKELLGIYEAELTDLKGSTDRTIEINKKLVLKATNRALLQIKGNLSNLEIVGNEKDFWENKSILMNKKISSWNIEFPEDRLDI